MGAIPLELLIANYFWNVRLKSSNDPKRYPSCDMERKKKRQSYNTVNIKLSNSSFDYKSASFGFQFSVTL